MVKKVSVSKSVTKNQLEKYLYEEGLSPRYISQVLKVSVNYCYKLLKRYRLRAKRVIREDPLTKDQLKDLILVQKKNAKKISKELNIKEHIIVRLQRKFNITNYNKELKNILTKDVLRKYVLDYGLSEKQIAEKVGCSPCTVSEYKRRYNIRKPSQKDKDLYLKNIVEEFIKEGLTRAEICLKLKCSHSVIDRLCSRFKLPDNRNKFKKTLNKDFLKDLIFNKKMSLNEIARELKCNISTVIKYKKKFKIGNPVKYSDTILTEENLRSMIISKKMSYEEVSKEFGISIGVIAKKVKEYNVASPLVKRVIIKGELLDLVKKMYYEDKESFLNISKVINLSHSTVVSFFIRNNLPRRNRKETIDLRFQKDIKSKEARELRKKIIIELLEKEGESIESVADRHEMTWIEVREVLRKSTMYIEWRKKVLKRDDYQCKTCGKKRTKLHVHHILPLNTYPAKCVDDDNGITLCKRCHTSISRKELRLASFFQEIILNPLYLIEC